MMIANIWQNKTVGIRAMKVIARIHLLGDVFAAVAVFAGWVPIPSLRSINNNNNKRKESLLQNLN